MSADGQLSESSSSRAPATSADAHEAIERVEGASADYLWHGDPDLRGCDAVVIPGGFSYGDYLRAGRDRALLAR